ncbi:MAG TPA: hypothetical protein VJO32_17375 [Ktedonobacteraceae bacterium]|nr:hypothetical protein [Ktedonobacteraceae bacterium]
MSNHTPTFADLCSAIAEGTIDTTLDGDAYQLSVYELRRYFNTSRTLPTLSSSGSPSLLAASDPAHWSASIRTSVA